MSEQPAKTPVTILCGDCHGEGRRIEHRAVLKGEELGSMATLVRCRSCRGVGRIKVNF